MRINLCRAGRMLAVIFLATAWAVAGEGWAGRVRAHEHE